jgi:hypothetical protein
MCASSCAAQSVAPTIDLTQIHNDVIVTCVSKLDNSQLVYLKSQRVDTKSTLFNDFVVSNVTDVFGVRHTVNQTEWTNENCSEKVLP